MPAPDQKTMTAVMYYGAKDIRIEDIPVPQLDQPNDSRVLIKVGWCGICGTDLHEYEAGPILCPSKEKAHPLTNSTLPICMGHEMSGTIVQRGSGVQGQWKEGDRVVVEPTISCSQCYACQHESSNACSSLGWIGLSSAGGLAEYIAVDEKHLHALPDSVSLEHGAMVEPLAVALHAVEASGLKEGGTALVLGAGPIGCFVTAALIAQGAKTVIVSEPSSKRREKAKHAGAHYTLDPRQTDIVEEVKKMTGDAQGVDCSFECAGVQKTLEAAIASLRTKGTCVNVAIWSIKPEIDMNTLLLGERTLKGVICYKNNHKPALEALEAGRIKLDGFVTGKSSLKDVLKNGFQELIENNESHVKILVSPTGQ